jgi:hypothetical protein
LHELCRALGFPGKPDGMHGGEVDRYVQEGRIAEVAAYCETDVVNTYRVWLVYELFRGTLSRPEFDASETNLLEFMRERVGVKTHLQFLVPTPLFSDEPGAGASIGEQVARAAETEIIITPSLLGHSLDGDDR